MQEIIIKICNGIEILSLSLSLIFCSWDDKTFNQTIYNMHPKTICAPSLLFNREAKKKNRLLYFKWKSTIYNALIWRNAVNKCVPFEIEVIYKSRHPRPQALDTMTIVICTLIVRLLLLFHQPNNYLWMHRHVHWITIQIHSNVYC